MEYLQEFYNTNIDLSEYSNVSQKVEEIFSSEKERTKKNIILYIVNLICSANACIAVAYHNSTFKKLSYPSWHSERFGVLALKLLKEKGLIKIKKGYRSKGFDKGFASTIYKTDKFNELFSDIEYKRSKIDRNECFDISSKDEDSEKITQFRFKSKENHMFTFDVKADKKKVFEAKYPVYEESILYSAQEISILNNEYFNNIELSFEEDIEREMISNVYMTRMFTRGGCGRLFQKQATSYQNIKKENRRKLLLNNEKTAELDYSSMHVNLLYAMKSKTAYNTDAYMPVVIKLVNREDAELRKAVKLCILIAINAKSMNKYKQAMRYDNKKETELLKQNNITLEKVIEAFTEVHPDIAEFLNSDKSIKLMFQDSNIIIKVLLKLKEENILSVPLHDSIICQATNKDRVKEIMQQVYHEVTNFTIPVEIK